MASKTNDIIKTWKFKEGDKVRLINPDSDNTQWFDEGLDNLEIKKCYGNGVYDVWESDKSCAWPVDGDELELMEDSTPEHQACELGRVKTPATDANYWDILEKCAEIGREREPIHGNSVVNHQQIATFATILTGIELKASDIAKILMALKLSRLSIKDTHWDSYEDLINYTAIAMQCKKEGL